MKKVFIIIFNFLFLFGKTQQIDNILKTVLSDSTSSQKKSVTTTNSTNTVFKNLSATDIGAGLKEALNKGIEKTTQQLSATDGFFKNAAIKILMPPEAQKMEKTLRDMGLGKQVDDAVLSMNRAAEEATKSAVPIFVDAIKQMSFEDATAILKGGDSAATKYLRTKTTPALTDKFKPIVDQSLQKVDAGKYWETVFTTYNKIPFVKKVNTDLKSYVTDKALSGLFIQLAQEEHKIRTNPAAQTTDLLKKVFGN